MSLKKTEPLKRGVYLAPSKIFLTIGLICLIHPYTAAQSCQQVRKIPADSEYTGAVTSTGKYCLTIDLRQPKECDIHAMRYLTRVGAPLLSILCPGSHPCSQSANAEATEINLQGHKLVAEIDNMRGIQDTIPSAHLRVYDGTIVVPGNREPNVGIDLQAMARPRKIYARARCKSQEAQCTVPSSTDERVPPYEPTGHVVEKVDVRAGWLGVQMVGIGNTVRDSVIEVDSRGAIALFGPGSKIENNTIIVHGKGDPTPDDGAIVLWDANGAVIRNNRFIFKGWFKKAPPAIRLIDSADAQLDGNTFEGFDVQVEQVGKSSFRINR